MSTIWKSTKTNTNRSKAARRLLWSRQQKFAMIACLAMLVILLGVSACSKQSPQSNLMGVSTPSANSPTAIATPSQIASTTTAAQAAPATAPKVKKTAKKHPANVTYADAISGMSFAYPRKFPLSTGDKAQPQLSGDDVPMNFTGAGGATVATVTLPKSLYPETDFASAFFSVNLNHNLSEEECSHFAFVDTRNADGEPVDAEKVKVGTADMEMTSEFAGSATKQAEAQYYHQYENGVCYEYVLGLGTAGYGTTDGLEPVDRNEVFSRLEKILASVKIRPVAGEHEDQGSAAAVESAQ